MFKNSQEYKLFGFTTDADLDIDSILKRYSELKRYNDRLHLVNKKDVLKALKNVYTLVGTDKDSDIFKNLGTKEYKNWKREEVYKWFKNGKIKPVQLSNRLDWHLNI